MSEAISGVYPRIPNTCMSRSLSSGGPVRRPVGSCGLRSSPPPKQRLPALVKRAHAFPAVFGSDQAIVGLDLECEAVPPRHLQAAMNGLLGLAHRERTVGGNAAGHFERGVQKAFGFDDPID